MGWIIPVIQSLQKKLLLISKSFVVLIGAATIFSYYAIKTIPSNAKSREEQDHTKQKFVGGLTAKLWPIVRQGVAKTCKRNENVR